MEKSEYAERVEQNKRQDKEEEEDNWGNEVEEQTLRLCFQSLHQH